ncbi:proteasome inhibitor PI31 subunit-like [Arctopsyche grandis]|uniref:proteasome inhibitor PI31 subunit-like n=1 Tax=Arctopsyche grandis TaxID=121162 RepID=UPI00406D6E2D
MEINTFGWDLLVRSLKCNPLTKEKILVAFIHWSLIRKKLKSIGIGEEKALSPEDICSELLPDGWDKNEKFSLRYLFETSVYILHGFKCGETIIFNLLDTTDLTTSNTAIDINDTVIRLTGTLQQMIPTYIKLTAKLESTLLQTIIRRTVKNSEAQTDTPVDKSDIRRIAIPSSSSQPSVGNTRTEERRQYPDFGESDLNPFGVGKSFRSGLRGYRWIAEGFSTSRGEVRSVRSSCW